MNLSTGETMGRAILNRDTLLAWKTITPQQWPRLLQGLLSTFFEVGPRQLEEFLRCIKAGQKYQALRWAHTLKSSCGTIGAEQCHDLLESLETLKEEEWDKIEARAGEIETAFKLLLVELKAFETTEFEF